jgi:putative IMPACT (imprinted ancient) family translation regulator
VTDILIVVVRYFGGTLLGVPGLINAYKTAASLVLQTTAIVQKSVELAYTLQFDYTIVNEVMNIIKQYNITVIEKDLNLFCSMKIGIQKSRLEEVMYKLKELRSVEMERMKKME